MDFLMGRRFKFTVEDLNFKLLINCRYILHDERSKTVDLVGQRMSCFLKLYVELKLFNLANIQNNRFINRNFLNKFIQF